MDNYNSPGSESCMVENSKITQKVIPFHESRVTTIQDRNYLNETQAIDSEKQFIENKVIKFKL